MLGRPHAEVAGRHSPSPHLTMNVPGYIHIRTKIAATTITGTNCSASCAHFLDDRARRLAVAIGLLGNDPHFGQLVELAIDVWLGRREANALHFVIGGVTGRWLV